MALVIKCHEYLTACSPPKKARIEAYGQASELAGNPDCNTAPTSNPHSGSPWEPVSGKPSNADARLHAEAIATWVAVVVKLGPLCSLLNQQQGLPLDMMRDGCRHMHVMHMQHGCIFICSNLVRGAGHSYLTNRES